MFAGGQKRHQIFHEAPSKLKECEQARCTAENRNWLVFSRIRLSVELELWFSEIRRGIVHTCSVCLLYVRAKLIGSKCKTCILPWYTE